MDRADMLRRLRARAEPWDLVVIGGGATGVGAALDAASRGYEVALVEQSDFGKGTSSRSTKLIHGGVRYLKQGNISLVIEALKERGILRRNAPHLVSDLAFVVPNYSWWEAPFYGIGMKVYDALAGKYGFGKSRLLSKEAVVERIPTIETEGLRGGVLYYDGQFDDSRLLIHLVATAAGQGALLVNYARVTGLRSGGDGFLDGVRVRDEETGEDLDVPARCVINATGAFSDAVRRLEDPDAEAMIQPSQGVHIVLDRSFLPGETAIMVPRTDDGRVLFAIPWREVVLIGTTDTPIETISLEPRPRQEEIDFLLRAAAGYLDHAPTPGDVRSVFAGIRPLVKTGAGDDTAALSREHSIHISGKGLLTIAGGKWTTYRKMAEDVVDHAVTLADLDPRPCVTTELEIHGYHRHAERFGELRYYGADAPELRELLDSDPALGARLHLDLDVYAGEAVWAVRREMARTVDDFLARRTRCLLLNARASIEAAPVVAALMAAELGRDEAWQREQVASYTSMAEGYRIH